MFNVLLDPLPEDWKGYPIDTDFQTGIMISQCLADDSLNENERFWTAVRLLFPAECPPSEELPEALAWFLNGFDHDNHVGEKSPGVTVMDFDIDQWRIYAAFRSQYQIDLNTKRLHWFTFMGLLANVEECTFTRVMDIRQKKITSKMSREEKQAIKKAQKIFQIKPPEKQLSAKEQQRVEEFMKYAHVKRGVAPVQQMESRHGV